MAPNRTNQKPKTVQMETPIPVIKPLEVINEKWLRKIMKDHVQDLAKHYFVRHWSIAFIAILAIVFSMIGLLKFSEYPIGYIIGASIAAAGASWAIFYMALIDQLYKHSSRIRSAKIKFLQRYLAQAKAEIARFKGQEDFLNARRIGTRSDIVSKMLKDLKKESEKFSPGEPSETDPHDPWYNSRKHVTSEELIADSSDTATA